MWFSPWMSWLSSGLGGQVVTAATLLLVAAAVVIGLRWASPNSALVREHVRTLWAFLSERG